MSLLNNSQSRNDLAAWQRYGVALAMVVLALGVKLALLRFVTHNEAGLLFFATVMVSAIIGGFGPGLLATVLGALCDEFFFMAPYGTWRLNGWDQVFRLAIFVAEAIFITLVCSRLKAARLNAEASRLRAENSAAVARELQQRILEISDDEQRRIGHDLHDGLGQHLTGIALLSRRLESRLTKNSPADVGEAANLTELAQGAIEWTHDLCRTLSPMGLESVDLADSFQELIAKAKNLFQVDCRLDVIGSPGAIATTAKTHLYRIAQEAISNAVRHGRARTIQVRLEYSSSTLTMRIIDDGVGLVSEAKSVDGMGLRIMKYRSHMIGGEIEFQPQPAGGTIVTCFCPMSRNSVMEPSHGNN